MSDEARASSLDGWCERTGLVAGRRTRWLERVIDATTDHREQYFGNYAALATRTVPHAPQRKAAAIRRQLATPIASSKWRTEVALLARPSELTVTLSSTALRTICDEIRKQERAVEEDMIETGGGIFGPPLQSWHGYTDVRIATVAAASRGRNRLDIAYGQIGATEAALARYESSHLRRLGRLARTPTRRLR
jgi:hypothetical protein